MKAPLTVFLAIMPQLPVRTGKLLLSPMVVESRLIVWNSHRTTAVVIRHDGRNVRFVPMKSGRLAVLRLSRARFDAEWRVQDYPLARALAIFLEHAYQHGATGEALRGLEGLARRDAPVINPLFE